MNTAVPLTPVGVLRLLAGADRAPGAEPPIVAVHVSGGATLSGALVAVGADAGNETLVLADRQTGRLGYAAVASIVAVELHNPAPFQDLLTGGRVPPPQVGEPVSRLVLRREFAPADGFPLAVDWTALPDSDRLTANLAVLLRGLRETVAKVRVDEMGRQAWSEISTLRVEHRAGVTLSVGRGQGEPGRGELSVYADLSAALPRATDRDLYQKISALL